MEWRQAEAVPAAVLEQSSSLDPLHVQLLWQRNVRTPEDMRAFLDVRYDQGVHDPFLFRRMSEAVDRLLYALQSQEVIMIHGDYDADGICGTTVLVSAMREVCARAGWDAVTAGRVRTYLPDREGDGYGMSLGAVNQFADAGVNLIVTVDCGIANTEQIAHAYERGMEVIVVDHHQLPDVLSEKAWLIHPLVPGETYPFPRLAAVGVAYKLACALYARAREQGIAIPEGYEKWLLDLVAIATITDMVPLIGENRVLETFGLMVLNKTTRPGLRALMEVAGLKQGSVTATDVGFRIGPRLNAAGRIAHASAALDVLLEQDPEQAKRYAERLNALNTDRQKLTDQSVRRARASVDGVERSFVAVVDESLRIGIAGLVAGTLSRELNRPTVVMTRVGEHFVGSGRAPEGFHFVEAMDTCREVMVAGGGHPQACGFTLAPAQVTTWIEKMEVYTQQTFGVEAQPLIQLIDAVVTLGEIDWPFVERVQQLEPFGVGNPQPVFATHGATVLAAERMGKQGAHLRLTLTDAQRTVRQVVGFGQGALAEELSMGTVVDVAFEVGVNVWQGRRDIQLLLIDLKRVSL